MDELYRRYGQLMIQEEIIRNQIQECKKMIAEGLSKQKVEQKVEDKKE